MEVHLPPDLEAELTRMAARQGRNREALVEDAVRLMVDYDTWFADAVETGEAEADRGELIEHEDVGARLHTLIEKRQPRG